MSYVHALTKYHTGYHYNYDYGVARWQGLVDWARALERKGERGVRGRGDQA
jgi:hypothetical protein